MIEADEGQPLISRRLAGYLLAAFLVPSAGGALWIKGWMSTVDVKLETVIANQHQTRVEMYPRSEANLQWQYGAQEMVEIKNRVSVLEARNRTSREDFPRADQSEVRRLR